MVTLTVEISFYFIFNFYLSLQLLLSRLLIFLSPRRFDDQILVSLAEGVGLLQSLGQLGAHRLGEEGGGEAAGEANEEKDEVGQPQVGGAQRHSVGASDTDHLRDETAEPNTGLSDTGREHLHRLTGKL